MTLTEATNATIDLNELKRLDGLKMTPASWEALGPTLAANLRDALVELNDWRSNTERLTPPEVREHIAALEAEVARWRSASCLVGAAPAAVNMRLVEERDRFGVQAREATSRAIKAEAERDSWKRRAEQHDCNTVDGDKDCG